MSLYCLFFLILSESTCTAVYISPNKCCYAEEKCLFKIFSYSGTDRKIRRYDGQNYPETRCRGIPMSWDIKFLRNSDPYARDITIKILHHSRLFVNLYLLVNTVIAMSIARKVVEGVSILT